MKVNIDGKKLRCLSDQVRAEIGDCGFALIVFELNAAQKQAHYISNVSDEFMITALEAQIAALKNGRTFPTPESELVHK